MMTIFSKKCTYHDYTLGTAVVAGSKRSETFLPGCIPDCELDTFPGDVEVFYLEVYADCGLYVFVE